MGFWKWLIPSLLVYRQCNKFLYRKNIDPFIACRILSTVHAIGTVVLCGGYLGNLWSANFLETGMYIVSPAYFLMDLMHITNYYNKYKGAQYWSYLLHHVITVYSTTLIPSYPDYFARGFLAEASTPLVNLSWYLLQKRQKGILYFANGVGLMGIFAVARVWNFGELLTRTWSTEPFKYNVLIATMWSMNVVWYYKLCNIYYHDFKYYLKKDKTSR